MVRSLCALFTVAVTLTPDAAEIASDHIPHRHGLRQIDSGGIPGAVCNGDTSRLYPWPCRKLASGVERSSAGWRSATRNCEATTLVVSVCVAQSPA